MVIRKREGSLSKEERAVVKSLLNKGWRNQDIQSLLNRHRNATVNSARITEVKNDDNIKGASDDDVEFFIKRKESFDPKTGLNYYDDEKLIRAREAMLLAVQVFNSPTLLFKTEVFAVLSNIAWTYLLHEYYERKTKVSVVGKDGYSLLLSQMIKRDDFPLSKGIRNNLAAMIKIRDDIEHLLLRKGGLKFYPIFQASCLNFDAALCSLFNKKLSLKQELSFALQFCQLNFEQIETIQKYDLPPSIEALDAELDANLSEEERADIDYQFKVTYTLESTAKSGAHIRFVRPESAEGVEIHNILEKRVPSDDDYPHKPTQVWKQVQRQSKKLFSSYNHTQAMYFYGARTRPSLNQPNNTNRKYCIYHKAHGDYTYSQAWVDHLVKSVLDEKEFAKVTAYKI